MGPGTVKKISRELISAGISISSGSAFLFLTKFPLFGANVDEEGLQELRNTAVNNKLEVSKMCLDQLQGNVRVSKSSRQGVFQLV